MRRALAVTGAVPLGNLSLTGRVGCGVSANSGQSGRECAGGEVAPSGGADGLPDRAGGLVRDRATEARVAGTMADVEAGLPACAVAGGSLVYAVYRAATADTGTGRPAVGYLYVGGRTGDRAAPLAQR